MARFASRWVALVLLMLAGPAAFAQLAGTYTINKNAATGGTNFASFSEAATALNTSGISASVRFNVLNGPYTEQFSLGQVTGVSATDTIVVDGGASKQTLTYTATSTQPAAVLLNGTDRVTLQNLTIDVSAGATYGVGVLLVGQANNNRVANCVVMAPTAATSSTANAAIAASGGVASATSAGDANGLRIENNVLSGGYYTVILTGTSTTARTTGIRITGNEIRDFYFYGLDLENTSGIRVISNNIHRTNRTGVSTFYGVYLIGSAGSAVERNRIHDSFTGNPASTSAAYGIYFSADGTAGAENDVVNNLVYNFNGAGTEYGLYNTSSDFARYYYNTVSLDNQAATGATQTTYGFYQTTLATGIELRNNVISVTRTGGTGTKAALGFITTTSTISSNYNDLYVGTGATYFTGAFGTSTFATLPNWRTANGGLYDANSVQVNPEFVSTTLVPSASPLNGAATPLARVTTDFTGAARNATAPDMGAYEFTPAGNDVALESIDSPMAPVATGARTVTVTVRNNGQVALNTVVLTYTLNGGTPVTQTFTLSPALTAGATRAVSFATPGTVVGGLNTLSVTASLPNGNPDANPANNTQTVTFYPALAGTYTINKNAATGGTNFASFSDAATVLNGGGISASVRFNVLNGPYTEQFALDQVPGVSATDTIVVDGGASKQTLTYSGTVTQPGAVVLNGTDRVTLQNLTIDASAGATYGIGVLLVGQANNNRVANCVVMGPAAATSATANAAIAASGGATSASSAGDANNLRIENNVLSGGYYGVVLTGGTARTTGIRVTGNEIRDFYLYGLDVESSTGAQLLGNNIHRTTRTGVSTFYGVYLTGVVGTAVERNRIHDTFTGNTASTSIAYGLYLSADGTAGAENDMVNNLVYNFNGSGTEYGIYNVGSDYARYYYNTISLDNPVASATTPSAYGFYQTTLATGIDFRNNIVSVTRTGSTGNKYALYFPTATSTITSNYNDLYVGAGPLYFTGRYGTVDYASLANWQTANGGIFDQNSVQVDPQFLNLAAGNLQPTASTLNGAATPLARVPRDFTNGLRSTTAPDLGAYEFTPATNDVAVETITSPTSPATPGARTVTVTIRNNGQVALNTVRLEYTLNGGTPVAQTFTLSPAIAAGATGSVSFTTQATLVSGANTLAVTASLPNGTTDANPNNNTQTVTLYTALAGTYTINKNAATGGTNFASFSEAAAALNSAGITASVRFNVLNGPYTEQFALGQVTGVSATDTIVVDGGTAKQTLRYTGVVAQPAAVLLNGTDYVTLRNLTIDASAGATYGVGVLLVGQANNNRVAGCVVMGPATATSSTANAAIAASGGVTSASTVGDANNLRIENNVLSGGYYGVIVTGASTTARNTGLRVSGNEVRDFYLYGIDVENQSGAQILANDVHRTTRVAVSTFYGVYLSGVVGSALERNRIHDPYTGDPTDTGTTYGMYFTASDGAAGTENDVVNNLLYNFTGSGTQYGFYNSSSDYARYYHNTLSLDNTAGSGATQTTYGFYQTTLATGIEFINNLVSVTRTGGTGNKYALYFVTTTSTITSNYNDLYVGPAAIYYTGRYGTLNYFSLADWRGANGSAFDQNSVQADPRFVNVAQGNYQPSTAPLDGAGTRLARVPRDIAGVLRSSPPDLGAYEFSAITDDVALVSIDSPTATATPGVNPLRVTIRNNGATLLASVVLTYSLNGGAPVAQTFTGLALAPNATVQLSFTPGLSVPLQGTNTLTVTASLPNGNPDGNATNNTLTITFNQPTPPNDEPCNAVTIPLGMAPVTSSNAGASTSVQNGINLPACGGGQLPRDVWFAFTPATPSVIFMLTGAPAGTVRIFSSPDCAAGPFTQLLCQGSGAANTSVGQVSINGLTVGTRYYVAVSGFGASDTPGTFTITGSGPLATRARLSAALSVYPNPSATGQLTLRLAAGPAGPGTVALLNALGQVVRQQPLAGTAEQSVSTRGLATGVYTLRVQAGAEVLTRKVVLQ